MELWAEIEDAPGYWVSTDGRVHGPRCMLNPRRDKDGYLRVGLHRIEGKVLRAVHRLVLEAFIGPAPEGRPQVAHWNGNPADNQLANLRWSSARENNADRYRHNTDPKSKSNNAQKTCCPQGHLYSPENTYIHRGRDHDSRQCRICNLAHVRAYRERNLERVLAMRRAADQRRATGRAA